MPAGAGAPFAARLRGVSKRFGLTDALTGVDLTIRPGEVLALLGENGAGKSTLVKVLTGVIAPDSGTIEVAGDEFDALTPRRAEDLGIARVAQELSLFPEMTVAANVLIGEEPTRFGLVDRPRLRRRTTELLGLLGVHIDPRLPVRRLALAERQLVEIAKAMARNPSILVLDEPTSGLREHEVEQLFHVVRRLRGQGCAVMFISHRMEEVFAIADRIAVLKDGRNSGEVDRADAVRDDIIRMMVGREVDSQFPARPPVAVRGADPTDRPALRAVGFGVAGTHVSGIDLTVYPGEVCGLAGLQGQGQTILLEGLFGLRRSTGLLEIGRHRGPFRHPGIAVGAGLALVPEDRKSEGGHLDFTVRANVTLPTLDRFTCGGVIQRRLERVRARTATAALGVRPADPEQTFANLSGGNQQKVVLARWLESQPTVLLLADPTRGVDIATKQEIYRIIRAEADKGVAVVVLSTELPELLGLCDRVLVMVDGSIAAEFGADDLTEEMVMAVAAGAGVSRVSSTAVTLSVYRPVRFGGVVDASTVAVYVLLAVTIGTYLALDPGTMTLDRAASLIAQRLPLAFVAVGQTIVVINRGFDLSVAGIVAVTNVVVANTMGTGPAGVAWGVATGLLVGLGAGLVNGVLVGYLRLPAIIVTLATWSILAGIALYVLPRPGGEVARGFADFPLAEIGPVPVALIALVAVPGLVWWPISRSPLGHRLLAVGGDERAAYESGLDVARTKVVAFVLCGLFASIGALFLTMQAASGDPRIGDKFTLNSIAAVALGGALLSGGRGSAAASVAGAFVLATMPSVLFLAGLSTDWQYVVAGAILVAAVAMSSLTRGRTGAGAT